MATSPAETSKASLVALLKERSVRLGEFTLSSGRTSHYYVDARPTTMSAEGLEVIGAIGVRMIADAAWKATLVGGLTLGADPVAYAIALASRRFPPAFDAFTVRKKTKEHGAGRRIEGCFTPDSAVVVVEDVITSGRSALAAIRAVEADGGHVAGVIGVVDRLEGGRAAIEAGGYEVASMVTIQDLGVNPESPVGKKPA